MSTRHVKASCLMVCAILLASCGKGKTVETAGPEAIQALEAHDYATVESLAKSVKGLGDFRATPNQTSLLERAAADGNAHLVDVLIQNGANTKATTSDGKNAVTMAVYFRANPETIRVLVKGGVDPNIMTTDGETPLISAAESGKADLVAALLEAGADPKLGGPGRTALDYAKRTREALASTAVPTTKVQGMSMKELSQMATKVGAGRTKVEDLDIVIAMLEAAMKGK